MRLTGDHLVLASWLLPSLSVPPAWPKFATNVRVSGRIPLEVDCQGFQSTMDTAARDVSSGLQGAYKGITTQSRERDLNEPLALPI